MLVRVTFETRATSADDGNIVIFFQDEDGIALSTWEGKAIVVSPTGITLRTYGTGMVTFASAGNNKILVPIPLDGTGAYLKGDYDITVWLDNTQAGAPTPDLEVQHVYNYCPHNSVDHHTSDLVKMESAVDCDAELITASDISDYVTDDITMLTRMITITPPSVANVAESLTTGQSLTAVLTYTNVIYSAELNVSFEYQEEEPTGQVTFISMGSAEIFVEHFVDCAHDICGVVKCLADRFDALLAKSVHYGGWYALPPAEVGNYNYAQTLIVLAQTLNKCGEFTRGKTYLDKAKVLLNCDCGCADNDLPKPL
jgi:hypothetical protein